jgi:hypothetical protein
MVYNISMNICPNCNHELVNIIYGYPSPKLIDLAKLEDVALGGCTVGPDMPNRYCYGCHETFSS